MEGMPTLKKKNKTNSCSLSWAVLLLAVNHCLLASLSLLNCLQMCQKNPATFCSLMALYPGLR